jgi:hypothetical protein
MLFGRVFDEDAIKHTFFFIHLFDSVLAELARRNAAICTRGQRSKSLAVAKYSAEDIQFREEISRCAKAY